LKNNLNRRLPLIVLLSRRIQTLAAEASNLEGNMGIATIEPIAIEDRKPSFIDDPSSGYSYEHVSIVRVAAPGEAWDPIVRKLTEKTDKLAFFLPMLSSCSLEQQFNLLVNVRDALHDEFKDLPPTVLEVLQSALDYGYDYVWLQF